MDAINPDHYKRLPAEAIEIIEAAIDNAPSNQDALLHGQVLKYILRCWDKNGIEDLRKAKWYLDRLIDSFDESEPEQPKPTLNSDTIPEGYRKLKDSSIEPRQRGDLRWSIAEKRYIEIGFDEIGYANRENWAACRKITQEVTGEVTGEVKPPDGWRWLEVGEVIRKGDKFRDPKSKTWIECVVSVGDSLQDFHKPTIRRNKFEVGEKVVGVLDEFEFVIIDKHSRLNDVYVARNKMTGKIHKILDSLLAPYIEETK